MIGSALGWKYNHEKGIETKDGKITAWPSGLGSKPSAAKQADIISEYQAHRVKIDSLSQTENLASIARKLEEIIDNIENETPLSTEAKDWMSSRKSIRA